jgi:hypothetical protein
MRKLLKYISQHRHQVPVPNNLTVTLPGAAVEDQNDVRASRTWDKNGMDVDGTPSLAQAIPIPQLVVHAGSFWVQDDSLTYYVAPLHVPSRFPRGISLLFE